jgi:hypothetical protein
LEHFLLLGVKRSGSIPDALRSTNVQQTIRKTLQNGFPGETESNFEASKRLENQPDMKSSENERNQPERQVRLLTGGL